MADYGSDTIDTGTLVINLVFFNLFFSFIFCGDKDAICGETN